KIGGIISAVKAAGDWQALVVDDGSADQTAAIAETAGAIVLRHRLNRGQGAALKTGIDYASRFNFETAVFFDADGQMNPAEIGRLIDKLDQGYDVVLGSRNLGRAITMPPLRKIIKRLALLFTRLATGLKITDTHIGFQAWRVSALEKIRLDQDRMAHASQILSEIARLKLNYAEVPVTITYTDYSLKKGQSGWNIWGILWDLLIK
ncbi:MAG: glycosyltransferase family 2 protein, partial [Patescibacteria group bacterium]